jgi:hypothetical protein
LIDVKIDISSSHIYVCIHGAKKQPPKDERGFGVYVDVEDHEVHGDE